MRQIAEEGMKPILFLLKPDFNDLKIGTGQQRYFCPHSAFMEGVLRYYPQLNDLLTIRYVDFPRPRNEVIDLIGEANQSCPSLVVEAGTEQERFSGFDRHGAYYFSNDTHVIAAYFAHTFGIALIHP